MPRSHLCKRKKKVIVVCKTAKHRDGKRDREDEEKIYSEREKEKKKKDIQQHMGPFVSVELVSLIVQQR